MGKKIRKISDIWNAIDNQRTVAKTEWRQSYIGVKAALQFIGLILITTQEDFESLEIPIENDGIRHFSHRKVIVSRNGKLSNSSRIQDLMSGSTKVYTDLEIIKIRDNTSNILKLLEPKGVATANNIESRTVDELDILIGVESIIYRVHLVEYRLADIAYSLKGKDRDIFLADQVKTSTAKEDGQLNFTSNRSTLTIGIMIKILKVGMSLTCIGKTQNNEIDVVWLFYGERAISMLSTFKLTQTFVPMLRLVRKTNNKFTLAYNDPEFRFDVKNDNERLLARKVEIVTIGRKHSLTFLNEDNSQIPSESHRIEQQSMNMTRSVCNAINIKVERHHKDACGPVDFIVNEITRVQDKVANKIFNVRSKYRLPYNPDKIDIFQVSDLVNNIVYAIPMRIVTNNIVNSFFTTEQLMKNTIFFGDKWKEDHKKFKHNFKKDGAISYVKACEEASKVDMLTDNNFYSNMIDENKDKFIRKARKI